MARNSPGSFINSPDYKKASATEGAPRVPKATWWVVLPLGDAELPVFVLDNGQRAISRTGATGILSDRKGGGNLENYLHVSALRPYIPPDLSGLSIEFELHITNKRVAGYSAETFIEICMKTYPMGRVELSCESRRVRLKTFGSVGRTRLMTESER